jgi:EH signature protein
MTQVGPGIDLSESLKVLQQTLDELKTELALPTVSVGSHLLNLSGLIKSLGETRPAKPIPNNSEYVSQWQDLLAGRRNNMDARAIRSLCWNPAIATDQSFQTFLTRTQHVPNSQSLQGMICSCHARWSRELGLSEAVQSIRDRLNQYSGRNRLLIKWKDAANMILGPKAHDLMAGELITCTDGLAGFCHFWGLSIESSQLFHAAAEVASALCLEQMDRVPRCREILFKELIPWSGWSPSMLKNVVSRLILFPKRDDTGLIEAITHLVRTEPRFGDPRHPQNHNNWIGMDEAAKRVQEWLSAADITFFFETVLPKGMDPHGRKAFWLRYVGCRGLRSRPLLSNSDKFRLRDVLWKNATKGSDFGRLLDEDTSAFILDFGPVMAIEFSAVGNACYLYEKQAAAEIVPDIWTALPFSKSNLKRKSKIATGQPMTHDRQNRWKKEMERILATYGVRAVS